MYKLVIDGQVGSAKSVVIDKVAARLKSNGKSVATINAIDAVRREMKNALPQGGIGLGEIETYLLVYNEFIAPEKTRVYAIEQRLREFLATFERNAQAEGADCLIYDRHWPTMYTQIDDATALTQEEKDSLIKYWINTETPPAIFFDTNFGVISGRDSYKRNLDIPWMKNAEIYNRDRQRRVDLFHQYRDLHVMDAICVNESRVDLEPITEQVYRFVLNALSR